MFAEKEQEIRPRDEIRLGRFDYIRRQLIRFAGDSGGKAQDLAGFRDPQDESSPVGRRGRYVFLPA